MGPRREEPSKGLFLAVHVARVTFSGLVKLEAGAVKSRSFPKAGHLFLGSCCTRMAASSLLFVLGA